MENSYELQPNYPVYEIEFNAENDCGFDKLPDEITDDNTIEIDGKTVEAVSVYGQKYPVHGTSNLLYVWEAYLDSVTGQPEPDPETVPLREIFWRQALNQNRDKMGTALDSFIAAHPNVFAEIYAIYLARRHERAEIHRMNLGNMISLRDVTKELVSDEEKARRQLYISQSLDGIAEAVKRLDLSIDIYEWCK